MPPNDEITTGELSRRLESLTTTITDGFKDLSEKVEKRPTWPDVRGIEDALLERIRKLEKWWTWLGTTIGGALILALLGIIIYNP